VPLHRVPTWHPMPCGTTEGVVYGTTIWHHIWCHMAPFIVTVHPSHTYMKCRHQYCRTHILQVLYFRAMSPQKIGMLISGKSHSRDESRNSRVSIETLDFARVRTFTCADCRLDRGLVEHRLVTDGQTQTDMDTGPWLVPRMHNIAR